MKLYKIDKGIKLPKPAVSKVATAPSRVAQTLQALATGDSFLIKDELEALKASKVVRDFNGRERERANGRTFSTRRIGDGIRIWRVK